MSDDHFCGQMSQEDAPYGRSMQVLFTKKNIFTVQPDQTRSEDNFCGQIYGPRALSIVD